MTVLRWDGTAWLEIGRETLQELAAEGGSARSPSLIIDSKGQAWLLWLSSKAPGAFSLLMAQWNGSAWGSVPVPRAPDGKDATIRSAHMILQNDVPIVAWGQSDDMDNQRVYVSEWMPGDQWNLLIQGLHVIEGVSDTNNVRLAARDTRSFFISWDEIGMDIQRISLVQAYLCEAGESPSPPPISIAGRDVWPKSVDEAARKIAEELDEDSKKLVRSTEKEDLIKFHIGWGTGIRNSFGMWRGNEELLKSCGQGKAVHPDNCSSIIIEAVWRILQEESPSTNPSSNKNE